LPSKSVKPDFRCSGLTPSPVRRLNLAASCISFF
jgi:hypothetical protein